jgi:succinate-acetate transporter protein
MGFALWYGGIVQILAGMWSMKVGNTFEATAFSSFGAYWTAYGYMFYPGSGIEESYANIHPDQFQNAKGIFLLIWFFLAIILTVGTTKSTIATISMFVFLDIHLILISINEFAHLSPGAAPARISAVFGILSALMAFWNGAAALWLPSNSHILLPVGPVSRKNKQHVYSV